MPIYLRNFYIKKLVDIKKEENKQLEKTKNRSKGIDRPNIPRP